MIYLDNAATTFPKPDKVIEAVVDCLKTYCGNPGRSSHALSIKASEEIYYARETVADFFGIEDAERVVFTHNATDALNLAIKGTAKVNSHVITSDIEHNATVRPLRKLEKTKCVRKSNFDSDSDVKSEIKRLVTPDTSCIISTLTSNVNGKNISLKDLSFAARELDLPLILDASQAAGHIDIDFKKTPFAVLCAPAHKSLFGIQGCGFAIFADEMIRDTLYEGGSGAESTNPEMPDGLPERFEAGTQAVPSIVALRHGIEFIRTVGGAEIRKKLSCLGEAACEMLSEFKKIKVFSEGNGIVSFSLEGVPSSEISSRLDRCDICTRSGLHCAPLAHKKLGTLEDGTVRISFSYFNTRNEIDRLYRALRGMEILF